MTNTSIAGSLKYKLKIWYLLSLIVALFVALVSIIGLLYKDSIYLSEDLLQTFIPNDIINLSIGLPFLLISLLLTKRGKVIGLLCWPGALFYILYIFLPYVLSVPFNILFLPYLIILSLSIYTLIGIIVSIDQNAIKNKLIENIPNKTFGGILVGLSVFIIIRQVALIINAILNNSIIDQQELAVWIDDLIIGSPIMLIGGYFLWKKRPLGYTVGAGLFISYTLLSFALIPFLVIQSYLRNTAIDLIGIIILLIMTMICAIPFFYFVKGLNKELIH